MLPGPPEMTLRVGIAGLGAAVRHFLSAFNHVDGVELTAVADVRPEALEPFRARGITAFESAEALFDSPDVDAVWIATPNELHMDHVVRAAERGKHIIGEKPMALTMEQAQAMIDAIERSGVKYVQGHSQMFRPPVQEMRGLVASGELGRPFAINNWRYQNWLNKPRLATELDTATGGGVVYRQGPHQTDIVRCIGGGMVKSVRAITGRWSPHFPNTEGNYTAFLEFENGIAATLVLSGYARFDSVELVAGEETARRSRRSERMTRALDPDEKHSLPEFALDLDGGPRERQGPDAYGLTVVSCERGDIRDSPHGVYVYDDEGRREIVCEKQGEAHARELEELLAAVREDRPPFPDARWGMATLEVIVAILRSSAEGREIPMQYQVPYVDQPRLTAAR